MKRKRADGDIPRGSHWEGKDLVVTVGGAVEISHVKDADGRVTVTCRWCKKSEKGLSGPRLNDFYTEHYKAHYRDAKVVDEVAALEDVDLEKLLADVRELAGDERSVVRLVVDGLLVGKPQYGHLDVGTDKRDFAREALHEGRDQLVYDAADMLRRVRRARARGDE